MVKSESLLIASNVKYLFIVARNSYAIISHALRHQFLSIKFNVAAFNYVDGYYIENDSTCHISGKALAIALVPASTASSVTETLSLKALSLPKATP